MNNFLLLKIRTSVKFITKFKPLLNIYNLRLLSIIILFILGDILLFAVKTDLIIFFVLGLYYYCVKKYKLASDQTFTMCLIILFFMFIEYFFSGTSIATEKAAVWLFVFLLVGSIQGIKAR